MTGCASFFASINLCSAVICIKTCWIQIGIGILFRIPNRGVTGYQILGGQLVMRHNAAHHRWPSAPSILPKTGWAIAHLPHAPLTPLMCIHIQKSVGKQCNGSFNNLLLLLLPRTTDTQWRHYLKKSENLGQCGRQNMLRPCSEGNFLTGRQ